MDNVVQFVRTFGIARLFAILGVTAGVAAMLAAIMMNIGSANMSLLYADLDLKEAGAVTAQLDQAGIKYTLKGDGSTIMVESDKVLSARVMLSAQGLPTSGSVGYEIFDKTDTFGQTEFVQNLNRIRALEGELGRTIRSIKGVENARVHLVLPERRLFQNDVQEPTASIIINAPTGLSAGQVRAVRNLVAGATPGLKPERVIVLDESGKMLAGGLEGEDDMSAPMADERESGTEERLRKQILEIVESVVGAGKAKVQVAVDMDFNRITETAETYDPDGQVARSTQTVSESANQAEAADGGATSASQNIPGAANVGGAGAGGAKSATDRTEETVNYEISKKVKTEVKESGEIKKLSVAVAVDGELIGTGPKASYKPRSADDMKRIDDLVRSAVGFDASRGDQISVVNVRFATLPVPPGSDKKPSIMDGFDKNDIMRAAEIGILALMAIILIFVVLRPLLKGLANPTFAAAGGPGMVALPAGMTADQLAIAGPQGQYSGPDREEILANSAIAEAVNEFEQRIEVAKVEGQVKVASVKKVAQFVEAHPDESVAIIRTWLQKEEF